MSTELDWKKVRKGAEAQGLVAMKEWSIGVTRAGPGPALDVDDKDTIEQVMQAQLSMEDHVPAGSFGGNSIAFTVAVKNDDPEEAIREAVEVTDEALRNVGLPVWPVVEIEAVEWSRFEKQLEEPTYPALVGVAELASMLGVSKQRASTLSRDPRFPEPHQELASGPVWVESNVRDFDENWVRKPGRPRRS